MYAFEPNIPKPIKKAVALLMRDFKNCFPPNHALVVGLQEDIDSMRMDAALKMPKVVVKKGVTQTQLQKRKKKVEAFAEAVSKKIVAAMKSHMKEITSCFRKSRHMSASVSEHLAIPAWAEALKKTRHLMILLILHANDRSQLRQALYTAALTLILQHFFGTLAKRESAAGRAEKRTGKRTGKNKAARATVAPPAGKTAAKNRTDATDTKQTKKKTGAKKKKKTRSCTPAGAAAGTCRRASAPPRGRARSQITSSSSTRRKTSTTIR